MNEEVWHGYGAGTIKAFLIWMVFATIVAILLSRTVPPINMKTSFAPLPANADYYSEMFVGEPQ